jgi:hypothetical protein
VTSGNPAYRAELDGQDRKVVVDTKIVYPYGVTVDFPNRKIMICQ